MLIESGAGDWDRDVGDNGPPVHFFSGQMDHGAGLARPGFNQLPDDLLPGACGTVGKGWMKVQQGILPAHLAAHDQHVPGQYADIGITACQLIHDLLVELFTMIGETSADLFAKFRG